MAISVPLVRIPPMDPNFVLGWLCQDILRLRAQYALSKASPFLLKGPRGALFLMSEEPLYQVIFEWIA